jgi:hypothetical protein
VQVGGDFLASVAFVRRRNEHGRHVLTVQYAAKARADGPPGANLGDSEVLLSLSHLFFLTEVPVL